MARTRKEQLSLDLQRQRDELSLRYRSLKEELSPGHQLRSSIRSHPFRWIAATAGSAFLASRLLRKQHDDGEGRKKRGGFLLGTGKLIFTLARPALTSLAFKKAQEHLETRLSDFSGNSMLGDPSQK